MFVSNFWVFKGWPYIIIYIIVVIVVVIKDGRNKQAENSSFQSNYNPGCHDKLAERGRQFGKEYSPKAVMQ